MNGVSKSLVCGIDAANWAVGQLTSPSAREDILNGT